MYISSNVLKKYIENSDKIDWMKMWQDFTIRSAEIDGIEEKGKDISNVVVAEILTISEHPNNEKYSIVKLNIGKKNLQVVCSAKNLYVGMKVPCALQGGALKGILNVSKAELGGVLSEGVLASEKELGISDDHSGVMDLNKEYVVGEDIKKYIPIDDIVVEIDNKSLTNRPDMWGHYGLAREVAAITGHKLLPLLVVSDCSEEKIQTSLNIAIEDKENCNRYSALKIGNITKKESNIWMRTMLYYCGMRSISLLVDLTNYLMLELGQPMHAFDSGKIDNIVVKNSGKEKYKFITLDGIQREIPENTLMICNGREPVAIAGIMGGINSEIDGSTSSLILESANFDATCIRKSAVAMGLRTEASSRYEKSLDPNMTVLAIKRFVKLLKDEDKDILIESKMADVYVNKVVPKKVILKKSYLKKYMGFILEDSKVVDILTSLEFKVEVKDDEYVVLAPTYRSTKDISGAADLIEEIARIYGYNNLVPAPLKLDLIIPASDGKYELEYSMKKEIASLTGYSEVHTYLWYQTEILNKYGIDKSNNISLVNKKDNNYVRDDISLSLFEKCLENSKYFSEYGVFEIGSCMTKTKEERVLTILSVCMDNNLAVEYQNLKKIVVRILKGIKNETVDFNKASIDKKYINNQYTLEICMVGKRLGYISVFDKALSKDCGKKISIVNIEINMDMLQTVDKKSILFEEPSKYPSTNIDCTIILNKEDIYENLNQVLKKFNSEYLIGYMVKDIYIDDKKKVTIRFTVGSNKKTLTHEEIITFQNKVLDYIEKSGYDIVK